MRSVDLLSDCTDSEIRHLGTLCAPADVAEGRTLVRQGDRNAQFVICVRGTAVASVDHQPVALIEAGSCFGELALFGGGIEPATVSSATPMELLVFGCHESMAVSLTPVAPVRDKVVTILAERRQALAELARHVHAASALDRLQDLPALQRTAI
jgi:CRP-like cAMP-binding protein